MLSGKELVYAKVAPLLLRDIRFCPPKMQEVIEELQRATDAKALGVIVNETGRTETVQKLYYEIGRTVEPGATPVTYAQTPIHSWHGFCLAIDVRSREHGYFAPPALELKGQTPERVQQIKRAWSQRGEEWIRSVAVIAKGLGLAWGGDWQRPDKPHFQWDGGARKRAELIMKPAPSDFARSIQARAGLLGVWEEVSALY